MQGKGEGIARDSWMHTLLLLKSLAAESSLRALSGTAAYEDLRGSQHSKNMVFNVKMMLNIVNIEPWIFYI